MEREDGHLEEEIPANVRLPFDMGLNDMQLCMCNMINMHDQYAHVTRHIIQ